MSKSSCFLVYVLSVCSMFLFIISFVLISLCIIIDGAEFL